jgi:hypothetical protein
MGEGRGVYRVFVCWPVNKRPLGRPRRTWKYNSKMDLRYIGIDGTNWIQLAQGRVRLRAFVNTVKTFGFHKDSMLVFDKLSDYQLFKEYPAPWSE